MGITLRNPGYAALLRVALAVSGIAGCDQSSGAALSPPDGGADFSVPDGASGDGGPDGLAPPGDAAGEDLPPATDDASGSGDLAGDASVTVPPDAAPPPDQGPAADLWGVDLLVAAPVITAISPGAGPTTGGTPITIDGTGFAAGATVTFDGVLAASLVTVVSPTRITAHTPTDPGACSRPIAVQVKNPDQQSDTRSDLYAYRCAFPDFAPPVSYGVNENPSQIVLGDFDEDGHLDLAASNYGAGGAGTTVSLFHGGGDGTFQLLRDLTVHATAAGPISVAAGDLDGDGHLDLATANNAYMGGGDVTVGRGNGDGTFQPFAALAPGNNPHQVRIADLDGDGRLDLVVDTYANARLEVLLADPMNAGSFLAPVSYATGQGPTGLALGRIDGDNQIDALVCDSLTGRVSLLGGGGAGVLNAKVDTPVGISPMGVALGDFNRDGLTDAAVANFGNVAGGTMGSVSVLLQQPNGALVPVTTTLWYGPTEVAAADLDGDGDLDLVVTESATIQMPSGQGLISVLTNDGNGVFTDAGEFLAGMYPVALALADLDGDGKPDIVVANQMGGEISVIINVAQ